MYQQHWSLQGRALTLGKAFSRIGVFQQKGAIVLDAMPLQSLTFLVRTRRKLEGLWSGREHSKT